MVETQQTQSPELKTHSKKKKNIFGGGGGNRSSEKGHSHHKVIADKVTLNIMRNTDIGDDASGMGSTISSLRTTMGGTVIDRGTEKLRALTKEDTEGENLIQN